eukprot:CAMPEP_0202921702 /NCGR_PEP_ID=MMETSP1392-20130828/77537_1 /ASSEMBLY_ACC=CAM_ASM_000868 /TAXON_ID=225041 /ORGANISM="Chlamydomonas chlamydogama, Strain SAG 11-48b" /LENGTH=212 /DNA_ID=CAMNT_0049615291 /DNA_START=1022 /DNA_END=1657 /DNA_ORIENTATION=-
MSSSSSKSSRSRIALAAPVLGLLDFCEAVTDMVVVLVVVAGAASTSVGAREEGKAAREPSMVGAAAATWLGCEQLGCVAEMDGMTRDVWVPAGSATTASNDAERGARLWCWCLNGGSSAPCLAGSGRPWLEGWVGAAGRMRRRLGAVASPSSAPALLTAKLSCERATVLGTPPMSMCTSAPVLLPSASAVAPADVVPFESCPPAAAAAAAVS